MRGALLLACLALTGCGSNAVVPDICQLPRNLTSWSGSEVRWSGVVIGTDEHGYVLFAENCKVRGIRLARWAQAHGAALLDRAIQNRDWDNGLLHVDVSGRIINDDGSILLWIHDVHRVRFDRTTDAQKRAWEVQHGL